MFDKYLCKYFQKNSITVKDIVLELLVGIQVLILLCLLTLGIIAIFLSVRDVTWDEWIEILEFGLMWGVIVIASVEAPAFIRYIGNLEVAHCKKK